MGHTCLAHSHWGFNGGTPFDYETFYQRELEAERKDKSWQYFNNINRLAKDFPCAHMAAPEDKRVTVWCSSDYLGYSKSFRRFATGLPGQLFRKMPCRNYSVRLVPFLAPIVTKGLHLIILFGSPPSNDKKDASGSMADSPDDPIMPAIPLIREVFPDLYLAADMSLCEYTHHGHCAVVFPDGTVDNEASVARVSDIALLFAQAGVYCAASSDMSNGRTRAIKLKLLQHRLESRSPLCSTPPTRTLARKAMLRDMQEGADMIMVKPAYPDILSDAKNVSTVPVVAMQVSGHGIWVDWIIVRFGEDAIVSNFTPGFLD
ncbi:hypothetical protein BDV40DRAFT_304901 [Aspergillus tamarii]|uniref:porphobilinogen synthase n=1 Tax=Aspergillus tamarii TaxID=41984 RepID=A0A5N6UGD2_ASPTM|nr:hypothetical protein BDV40DRAFT_304901 [Aspergillus tamarii]